MHLSRSIKQRCAAALLAFTLVHPASPAVAQTASDPVTPISRALGCLSRSDGAPAALSYPVTEEARKEGGTVHAQLKFSSATAAPEVTILSRPRAGHFDDAVIAWASQYRVPCMAPGEGAVTLTQEFVFDVSQLSRVVALSPRDAADDSRRGQLQCMRLADGAVRPGFPRDARQHREEGTMIVRLRFTSADSAPTMEIVQPVHSRSIRRTVTSHVADLRLPCLESAAVDTLIAYKFFYTNDSRELIKDSSLLEALAAARDLKKPVHFNFRNMACPFDLRVSYHQPYSRNTVQQLDHAVTEREPLARWLEELTLDLPNPASARLFGAKFIITVPCGELNL